jgi:hypothetical protein
LDRRDLLVLTGLLVLLDLLVLMDRKDPRVYLAETLPSAPPLISRRRR